VEPGVQGLLKNAASYADRVFFDPVASLKKALEESFAQRLLQNPGEFFKALRESPCLIPVSCSFIYLFD